MKIKDLASSQLVVAKNSIVNCSKQSAPKLFLFTITNRCNSRCVMCKIWQQKALQELSLNQISEMLDDPIFKSIEYVTLTGGEPTLREDIALIVKLLVEKCPRLQSIHVPTNGLITELVVKACHAIDEACEKSQVTYGFGVSLDGIGDVHERVRGIPNAFGRTAKTIEVMRELQHKLGFSLSVHCVVSNVNVYGLSDFTRWCNQKEIPYSFQLAHRWKRFLNENSDFQLSSEQMRYFLKNLWDRVKEPSGTYYDWMTYRMVAANKKRSLLCPFVVNGFNIQSNGDIYYCPDFKSIGNIFQDEVSNIYYDKNNLRYRERIRTTACSSCTNSCWWYKALHNDYLQSLRYNLIKRIMK